MHVYIVLRCENVRSRHPHFIRESVYTCASAARSRLAEISGSYALCGMTYSEIGDDGKFTGDYNCVEVWDGDTGERALNYLSPLPERTPEDITRLREYERNDPTFSID